MSDRDAKTEVNVSILEVAELDTGYSSIQVLNEVSLQMHRQEILGIVGPNGHGKTTLLGAISGLVPTWKGKIRFCGQQIDNLPAFRRRRQGVAHVPQGDFLFSEMTVLENLIAGTYGSRSERSVQKRVDDVFDLFPELDRRSASYANVLSGGERRMLAIGRTLMAPCKLLLVDEPSTGLSPNAINRVYSALGKLRDEGLPILIVEETLSRLQGFADRLLVLDSGRLSSRSDDLKHAVERLYLGSENANGEDYESV